MEWGCREAPEGRLSEVRWVCAGEPGIRAQIPGHPELQSWAQGPGQTLQAQASTLRSVCLILPF